jgi:hypothetical protein
MVGEIRDRLSPYRQYHPAETDRLVTSHDAHKEIVNAIVEGQGERAYLAMRAHNAHLGNAALRALRQARENEGATDGKMPGSATTGAPRKRAAPKAAAAPAAPAKRAGRAKKAA